MKQKSTIEIMQLGVAFAEKHKTESEPYNSGIGYGYACGYEAAMEELVKPSKMNSDLYRAAGLLDGGISAWKTIGDKVKPEGMADIMIEVRGLIEKYLNK